jgi:hypothetical protein
MQPGPAPIPCGIDAIARRYGVYHCVLAADWMQQALEKGSIRGIRIELSMPHCGGVGTLGNIYADEGRFTGRTISSNGRHVAIEVVGIVYDNNRPTGATRADWLGKMHTQFGTVAEAVAVGIMTLHEIAF